MALNLAPFGRWTLRDKAAQRRLALRYAFIRVIPMKYDLEGKTFRSVKNTDNGEVGADTVFCYHQSGNVVSAEYSGGAIVVGHLVANVLPSGQLDMRYHHVNREGEIMIGKCLSTPELTDNGKLLFKEKWQWLSGDLSSGYSEIIEQ